MGASRRWTTLKSPTAVALPLATVTGWNPSAGAMQAVPEGIRSWGCSPGRRGHRQLNSAPGRNGVDGRHLAAAVVAPAFNAKSGVKSRHAVFGFLNEAFRR